MTKKIECRTPRAGEWIRVNPDPKYRSEVALVRSDTDDRAYCLVSPEIVSALEERRPGIIEYSVLFLTCNRDNEHFLWPVRQPVPEAHFVYRAMEEWICFSSLQ